MKIAIIGCDYVDPEQVPLFGEYPDMFRSTLSELRYDLEFTDFDALRGQLPDISSSFDGYIITGSRYNSYDNDPWILKLLEWIQYADQARIKVAGICFGHQLIARALGAQVHKSTKGWGLGKTQVQVAQFPNWVTTKRNQLRLWVSHQDQVETKPPGCKVIAQSDFCPYFMLAKDRHIFTIQGHPEFLKGYTQYLLSKHENKLTPEGFDKATTSLEGTVDSKVVLQWILDLFSLNE
ncbi:MAG: Carbamoyl-phosphate synthase small chain [Candidatus Celerinatantimonas neptuna]|nr:MAG: Carbamoyl-phosphate synthase small chain [Candidatus Celerinatantimonas neptuna]